MTSDPTDGPCTFPTALVLVASRHLAESLRRVQESGWTGPVVVVGDAGEATELARRLRPGLTRPEPQPGPSGPGPQPGPAAADRQQGPSTPAPRRQSARLELILDPDRQLVASGGRQVHLTPLEYAVLHALVAQPRQVRRYAELTEEVWGTGHVGDTAQVHSVVKRVRRKLDEIGSPVQVQVVHGVGFRAVRRS